MAWNKPSVDADKAKGKRVGEKGNVRLVRGIIAAAIVVVGSIGAWWLLSGDNAPSSSAKRKSPGAIREVKPAPAPKPLVAKPGWVISTNKFGKVYEHPVTNAWGNPWSWGPQKLRPAFTSRTDRASLPLYMRVFKNGADRQIAALLTIEPGTPLVGGDNPPPMIEGAFQQALKHPVLVSHEDTEEVKELKRAVNAAKADLKARIDAGEDLVTILTESRRELRELGAYRQELQKQIDQFRAKREATPEDLHDMVDAANLMLKERGLKELSVPEFYYRNLETRIKLRKAREANEQ